MSQRLIDLYRQQAKRYDDSGIRALRTKRRQAIRKMKLQAGDHVIDIGCGTGLNFSLLQEAVGPAGKITGVDLTDAMLDQARERIEQHGWSNVELVQSDAATYTFPQQVDGIVSTFALSFIPGRENVVHNGVQVLGPTKRWVVLDMAWPQGWPAWLRHLIPFLASYGITQELIDERPWLSVQEAMQRELSKVEQTSFWMGFFYIACGTKAN